MASSDVRELRLKDALLLGWERCAGTNIFGYQIKVCASIVSSSDTILLVLTVTVGGETYRFEERLNGNQCFRLPLFGPLSVEACVSKWEVGEESVSFTFAVFVAALGIRVKLFEERITIPFFDGDRVDALESVQVKSLTELTQLLGVLGALERNAQTTAGAHGVEAPSGCACGCGSHGAGAAPSVGWSCPSSNELGFCYANTKYLGKFTCQQCCTRPDSTGWRGENGEWVYCPKS